MLDAQGKCLLAAVIARTADLAEFVKTGDCVAIAISINSWIPHGMGISIADVFDSIKDRSDFAKVNMNAELLRARIDGMPVLYSARITGSYQAIANELNLLPEFARRQVSIADVAAAMAVHAVPKPTRIVSGAATMTGRSRIG